MRVDLNLAALVAYGVLLGLLSWMVAEPFWPYLVLGLLIAVLAFPLHDRIRSKLGRSRISAAITVLIVLLLVIVPMLLIGWKIVQDIRTFVADLTVASVMDSLQSVLVWSNETIGYPQTVEPDTARELLAAQLPAVQEALAGWALTALASTGEIFIGLMLTVILAFYGLVSGEGFLARFKDASPMDDDVEEHFFRQTKLTIDGVIWGQIVTAVLQGFLGWLAFVVVGISNAIFWGFVMAILSVLPLVGAFLVWIPAALYLLVEGQLLFAIGLILWGSIVVGVSDDVVRPMVIGRSASLHPVLAFVGVLGGLFAFGIMGFVLGPLVLSLFAVVFNVLADSGWDLDAWEPPKQDDDGDAADDGEGTPA